jgi:hypothetical protein
MVVNNCMQSHCGMPASKAWELSFAGIKSYSLAMHTCVLE